ncbi:hypothetical protein BT93_H1338 [Corymbia citriodora subsp. variegata]|nr:hypothetical protein BT93_H1338 [Corymbia citriodora subsp. variegata]KAF8015771.1 hypothetical protein BT93_H1338 [Corymbia citriodora subsp. variegata]KAF8015772.1 hypothetical protein BT93_H1338 [Corymbia citriodora subsp. variegata]
MVNSLVITEKDVREEEDSRSGVRKKVCSSHSDCSDFSKAAAKRMDDTLVPNISQSQSRDRCAKDATAQRLLGLSTGIPKHLVALEENYLRHCLDLVHRSASKDATCNILVNLTSSPNFQCSLSAIGTGNVVRGHAGLWIIDSIMGSKTNNSKDIDQSPLFCHFGALGNDAKYMRSNPHDAKDSAGCNLTDSPNQQSVSSPIKMENEVPFQEILSSGDDSKHERLISVASTSSRSSDRCSSSPGAAFSQGMLHCTWKVDMPHFVLSIDDQREILVADPVKVRSSSLAGPDWVYVFYSKRQASTEHMSSDNKPHLIGKMEVVSSMSLCQENLKIVQTEFVLFGGWETVPQEGQTTGLTSKKNNKLAKKVANVFRPGHSSKQRSVSGQSEIWEDYSPESSHDVPKNLVMPGGLSAPGHLLLPNLELAAIVVKNRVEDIQKEETGGWGLKFLKKNGVARKINQPDACTPVCSDRDSADCVVSVEVAVPAGLHGGPRKQHGGPSSLIERWKSGGQCDCGGWDLGCPLTLFKARSSDGRILNTDRDVQDCKSFDLYIQGSEHCLPTLRMTDVRDGLYLVHFNSALSPLQSFSIAIAHIHSQSCVLQSKLYRS